METFEERGYAEITGASEDYWELWVGMEFLLRVDVSLMETLCEDSIFWASLSKLNELSFG